VTHRSIEDTPTDSTWSRRRGSKGETHHSVDDNKASSSRSSRFKQVKEVRDDRGAAWRDSHQPRFKLVKEVRADRGDTSFSLATAKSSKAKLFNEARDDRGDTSFNWSQ
jgi:hypothetical protein